MQAPNTKPMSMNSNNQNIFNPRPSIPLPRPSFSQEPAPSLPGFYISSDAEIKPRDVPMDGSISFFPFEDLSKIAVRQWDKYGNIECATYILDKPDAIPNQEKSELTQETQQSEVRESEIIAALNNLNQGLASTFTTFADVLRDMRDNISTLAKRFEEEDGRG